MGHVFFRVRQHFQCVFNAFSMQYQKLHVLFFNGVRFKISQNICTLKKIAVPLHHWKRKTASKGSWNLLIPLENTAVLSVPSPGGGMVDARVSGARAERRAGSSPVLGTHKSRNSLKIKSCGIFHSIFVSKLSAKVWKIGNFTLLNRTEFWWAVWF